jgi:hypothetical protein
VTGGMPWKVIYLPSQSYLSLYLLPSLFSLSLPSSGTPPFSFTVTIRKTLTHSLCYDVWFPLRPKMIRPWNEISKA